MSELVFLRSKAYAFKVSGEEFKRLKGITKSNDQTRYYFSGF